MANHRRGEKAKLLAAVEELCNRLGRPISSGDLRAYFHEYPERRPCLLKRLGQQLISASEEMDGVVPYIKPIGLFRYKAYYALEDTRECRERFSDYCASERIAELMRLNIPDHIATLIDTGFANFASHAANGWLAEITHLAKDHSDPDQALSMARSEMDFVAPYADGSFAVSDSLQFMGRNEAMRFLVEEAGRRRFWDTPLSPFRYLARFRWPQFALFTQVQPYCALSSQLSHFIRGKWPICDEMEGIHRATAECLRYGVPANLCISDRPAA